LGRYESFWAGKSTGRSNKNASADSAHQPNVPARCKDLIIALPLKLRFWIEYAIITMHVWCPAEMAVAGPKGVLFRALCAIWRASPAHVSQSRQLRRAGR
jgi:hypothetical protein